MDGYWLSKGMLQEEVAENWALTPKDQPTIEPSIFPNQLITAPAALREHLPSCLHDFLGYKYADIIFYPYNNIAFLLAINSNLPGWELYTSFSKVTFYLWRFQVSMVSGWRDALLSKRIANKVSI